MEQAGRIAELRLEPGADFFSDLIAADLNSGADSGLQVTGTAAEATNHLSDALLDDALDGAAPTCVEHADCMALRIHYHHGQAIGGLDRKQQARSRGDHAIAGER